MLTINYNYEKGIFFIRLIGTLNFETSSKLKQKIIPLILDNGFKYIVINLDEINYIDEEGINTLNEINESALKFNGKTTIIKNKYIEKVLSNSEYKNVFYRAKDEKVALGVFEL